MSNNSIRQRAYEQARKDSTNNLFETKERALEVKQTHNRHTRRIGVLHRPRRQHDHLVVDKLFFQRVANVGLDFALVASQIERSRSTAALQAYAQRTVRKEEER